jgi:hypothetical protein
LELRVIQGSRQSKSSPFENHEGAAARKFKFQSWPTRDPRSASDLRTFPHDQHDRFVNSVTSGKNGMPA